MHILTLALLSVSLLGVVSQNEPYLLPDGAWLFLAYKVPRQSVIVPRGLQTGYPFKDFVNQITYEYSERRGFTLIYCNDFISEGKTTRDRTVRSFGLPLHKGKALHAMSAAWFILEND
jgi:hypothetical protein